MKNWLVMFVFMLSSFVIAQQPQGSYVPLSDLKAKYVQGGYDPTPGSGLTLNLGGGTSFCGGSVQTYSGGTLTMTASTTNYVYLNASALCAPAVKTPGFNSSDIPIAIVVTGTSAISGITDVRTPYTTYGACGTAHIPCTNTANIFTGGLQTTVAATSSTVSTVVRGASSGYATISLIQESPVGTYQANTVTLGSAVTAGDSILVISYGGTGIPTDTLGNTYTQIVNLSDSYTGNQFQAYLAYSPEGGMDTISAGWAYPYTGGYAMEFSNVLPSSALDGTPIIVGGPSPLGLTEPSGSVTTTQAGDLIISALLTYPSALSGQSVSGYSLVYSSDPIPNVAYAQQSSSGTFSNTWSTPGRGNAWSISNFALKAKASTGQLVDLTQYQSFDSTFLSSVNNVGQFVPPSSAGCPTNTPSYGALAYDTTASDYCKYTSAGWVHVAGNGGGGGGGGGSTESHTAIGSAELDFTTCITSANTNYKIIITDLLPATNSIDFLMQFSTNGGSTWDTSSTYGWAKNYAGFSGANGGSSGTATGFSLTGGGALDLASTVPFEATFNLYNPLGSSAYKTMSGQILGQYGGQTFVGNIGWQYRNTNAVNAFRIIPSSGNITSGTVACYAIGN